MTFKTGQSGNPKGRSKGSLNKRTQLSKLFEPHAKELIEKTITLALSGDTIALRLCIERLIPKINREPICIDIPDKPTTENIRAIKMTIFNAALNGLISADEADKLIQLVKSQYENPAACKIYSLNTVDPIEASRVYQQIMMSD